MDNCFKRIEINNNLINGPANVVPPTAPTAPTAPTQPTIPPSPTAPTGLNKVYGLQPFTGNTAVFDGFTNEQIGTLPTFFFFHLRLQLLSILTEIMCMLQQRTSREQCMCIVRWTKV